MRALIAVSSVVVVFVAGRAFLDRLSRDNSLDVCERSDLDLVRAAGAGDVDMVRSELEDRDPDERDRSANTALGCAIPRHRTEAIAALLEGGADPDQPSGSPDYVDLPIELAHEAGDRRTLVALLEHGADPNLSTPGQESLLLIAIRAHDDELVVLLLDHGAAPSDGRPDVPLAVAAGDGTDRAVELLLARGASPDGVPDSRPLVRAAASGRAALVDRLLVAGADLSAPATAIAPTTVGAAVLAEVAGDGDLTTVADLLGRGVDPNEPMHDGPLLRAATFGHREVAAALLDAGADPDLGETDELTAAFVVSMVNPTLAERLRGPGGTLVTFAPTPIGADPSAAPEPLPPLPVSPLAAAVVRGDRELVALLLDHGADPDLGTRDDLSPLVLAGLSCDAGVAELLLAAGAEPVPATDPAHAACPAVQELLLPR